LNVAFDVITLDKEQHPILGATLGCVTVCIKTKQNDSKKREYMKESDRVKTKKERVRRKRAERLTVKGTPDERPREEEKRKRESAKEKRREREREKERKREREKEKREKERKREREKERTREAKKQ
jgi:ATP-dependent RNA helicase DDX46/PRP5